jgi:hypothetical protein
MEIIKKAFDDLVNESNLLTLDDENEYIEKANEISDDIATKLQEIHDETIQRIQKKRKMLKQRDKMLKHAILYFDLIKLDDRITTSYKYDKNQQSLTIQNKNMKMTLDPSGLSEEIIRNNETTIQKDDSLNRTNDNDTNQFEQLDKQIEQSDELTNNHDETETDNDDETEKDDNTINYQDEENKENKNTTITFTPNIFTNEKIEKHLNETLEQLNNEIFDINNQIHDIDFELDTITRKSELLHDKKLVLQRQHDDFNSKKEFIKSKLESLEKEKDMPIKFPMPTKSQDID